jgi:hypothetical protein
VAYLRALRKFRERLEYRKPVYSMVDYVVRLVQEEIRPGYVGVERGDGKPRMRKVNHSAQEFLSEVGDWMMGFK